MISARACGMPALAVPGDQAWDGAWSLGRKRETETSIRRPRIGTTSATRVTVSSANRLNLPGGHNVTLPPSGHGGVTRPGVILVAPSGGQISLLDRAMSTAWRRELAPSLR